MSKQYGGSKARGSLHIFSELHHDAETRVDTELRKRNIHSDTETKVLTVTESRIKTETHVGVGQKWVPKKA